MTRFLGLVVATVVALWAVGATWPVVGLAACVLSRWTGFRCGRICGERKGFDRAGALFLRGPTSG